MKTCTICKISKKSNEFYSNPGTKDELGSQCKSCDSIERRKKCIEKKKILVDFLGGQCIVCGYKKCLNALDFHHKYDKNFNISSKMKYRLEILLEEIKKCDLLCANCHREKHF